VKTIFNLLFVVMLVWPGQNPVNSDRVITYSKSYGTIYFKTGDGFFGPHSEVWIFDNDSEADKAFKYVNKTMIGGSK
jgi:hypothetical protein